MEQGVIKTLAYKKQSGKGSPASGAGGQLLRRETATFSKKKDTYSANEITSHRQHTGDKHGIGKSDGTLSGLLSGGSYAALIGSLLAKDLAATAAITGLSLTIAGSGPYTITRGSGSFLTDGAKIGDVIRLTAGSFDAANLNKNLLITAIDSADELTVLVLNGSALEAEGPISSATVTFPGKKSFAANTGHTNDWYTFEELFSSANSHLWPDMKVTKADLAFPSTGNVTIGLTFMGLGERTKGGSAVLTSPSAETTSEIYAAVNGFILIDGVRYLTVTAANLTIDSGITAGEAVIGSNTISDNNLGTLKVNGTLSILYEDDTVSDLFDSEADLPLVLVVTTDDEANAEFVTFVMSKVKIFGDDVDDGKKQLIRSYPFTAEINGAGGAAAANDKTTISMQDSLAS